VRAAASRLCAGLIAAALGCHASDETRVHGALGPAASRGEASATGSLAVPLVTPDAAPYRLRTAVFDVQRSGVLVVSLDSEASPDARALTAELDPGQYEIRLNDGWSLERLDAQAVASPVRGALISPNPVGFGVRDGRVTSVAFTFTTSAGLVTFGKGAVSVRLGVTDPSTLSGCDVVNQAGCAEGQHCLLGDADGKTFCATPGELPPGAPCGSEQCVLGAQCLALDIAAPEETTCTALCNPLAPPFGCDCRGLGAADDIGICGPPPPGPGSATEGESCFGEECQAGLDCFGDDAELGFTGTCYRFCDVQAPECEFCFEVDTGSVGRCFL
jgi:hypothetical protein